MTDWRHAAACRDEDPELFFPLDKDLAGIAQAKNICAGCDVRRECHAWADAMGLNDGIYGGHTAPERSTIRRRRQRDAERRRRLAALEADAAVWRGQQLGRL